MKNIKKLVKNITENPIFKHEEQLLSNGQILSRFNQQLRKIDNINHTEFKVFSQWGDDGIIDWLVNNIEIDNKTFIEFGVENYQESNTRFLMMSKNWSGLIIDGSEQNIDSVKSSEYYWKYDLTAKHAFITAENINQLISEWTQENVGLLHIDIDGNDYWVWQAITVVEPEIVIVEYNAVFGNERAISVPYQADFVQTQAHYSNLYFGASLPAFCHLATQKGYIFIGCNLAGNNAYFVRKDKVTEQLPQPSITEGFQPSKFRQSRDENYKLTFLTNIDAYNQIKGLSVSNIITNEIEQL